MDKIVTDYLVIGAGASAMAFVDTLLDFSDADIVMVDKRDGPGGHWNDAYPFVRLHQPSSYYGVASTELGEGAIDQSGTNAGFEELATKSEILDHFNKVMQDRFLPSGRVRFLGKTEADPNGALRDIETGKVTQVDVRKRVVDCTLCENTIPATHVRKFDVHDGVTCIPPNSLADRIDDFANICVLGAGKTGMDTIVSLVSGGVSADRIHWVMPRDPWMINRAFSQPTPEFFFESYGGTAKMLEAFRDSETADEFARRMEKAGLWLRLDLNIQPKIMHGPTIAQPELEFMRAIKNIIRKGRVTSLGQTEMTLTQGGEAMPEDTLFVDCTASALSHTDTWPVFTKDRIGIQMVRLFQPCFSAALIARIEAMGMEDAAANRLLTPLPMTDTIQTWIAAQMGSMMNQGAWMQVPELKEWIKTCRLDGFGRAARGVDRDDPAVQDVFDRLKQAAMPAMGNMQKLMLS